MSDLFGGSSATFLGTFTPKLDEKGRLFLPAKFRVQFASGLVMTRGQERCLYLLPPDAFLRMLEPIRQAAALSKESRSYQRVLLSGATDDLPDKQGRISIPPILRTYAGLARDVAVIGADTHVEIWDLPTWEAYLAAQEDAFADADPEVVPMD